MTDFKEGNMVIINGEYRSTTWVNKLGKVVEVYHQSDIVRRPIYRCLIIDVGTTIPMYTDELTPAKFTETKLWKVLEG